MIYTNDVRTTTYGIGIRVTHRESTVCGTSDTSADRSINQIDMFFQTAQSLAQFLHVRGWDSGTQNDDGTLRETLSGTVGPKQETVDLHSILNHQENNLGTSHRICCRFRSLGFALARQKPINRWRMNIKASDRIACTKQRSGHAVAHRSKADKANFGYFRGCWISLHFLLLKLNVTRVFHNCIRCIG